MKKILVIGASGSLAEFVIEELQQLNDVALTLFVRSKKRLASDLQQDNEVIEGDAMNYNAVKNAITGKDIVYVNLAGNLESMTKNIVGAMLETGVKRIIAISSIGIYDLPLKPVLVSYRALADIIESSGLEYTILRPDWFTYANEVDYALTKKGEPETGSAVSRRSIANFIRFLIENPESYKNENLGISRP